jgi:Sulfotransferase family
MNATHGPDGASPLDRFCATVLGDPSLQDALRRPRDSDEFIALVAATARRIGILLTPEDVQAAMRGHLPGMGDLNDRLRETPLPPDGWLPIGTSWQDGRLYVQWTFLGDQPLREPFFQGDVHRNFRAPFNRLFRHVTPIERLPEWLGQHPPLRPSGFIFHMSRCGSTLVSQMLAACADNVVISEAAPIDEVVRARQVQPALSEDEQARWLASIIGALGQPRAGGRRLFVKLDCWHTLSLPLFRRAFPDVPWVFLYRDPVEVMVSQRKMPGMQMIPGAFGPELLGIAPTLDRREDYCARVLARICEPIAQQHSLGGGLLVNYRDLPDALWTAILPHFGVAASAEERATMEETAKFDAKEPSFAFTPDAEAKQRAASAATRAAASERLGDIYGRLEALRLGA